MNVYVDCETIPCQQPSVREELAAEVKPPATHKKPETIAAWLAENRDAEAEAAWLKTSFDGGLGQVVCIAWALEDGDIQCLSVPDLSRKSEAALLEVFFSDMAKLYNTSGTKPVLIGHNHIAFDLPFLLKRCYVHNIKPAGWWPRNPKPWADSVQDTMLMWDATQRHGGSMDRICKLLGIPGKNGMTGADVWPMVKAGDIDGVATYCRDDVERTRAMFKRMTFADDHAAPPWTDTYLPVTTAAVPVPAKPTTAADLLPTF